MISPKTIKVLAFGSLVTALSMFVIVVSSINVQAETSSGTNTSSGEKSVESKKNIEELRLEKQKKLVLFASLLLQAVATLPTLMNSTKSYAY